MTRENHLPLKSLMQLFNDWEIQLLVLLSFLLQFFLFFAGGFRRRVTKNFLRILIWLAYLGADLVAAYVIGLISRHQDGTTARNHDQLTFLWAPFLLIHLGGQDTVTAFAIEDNKLWLRHLLNLVFQVSLTMYIFWKSTGGHDNMQLLAPSILLFVTGTIKYGERTWALWCGNLINIASSPVPDYLRPDVIHAVFSSSDLVSTALVSIKGVRLIFSGTGIINTTSLVRPDLSTKLLNILEIELSLMFDDIYTKAMVLRTWGGTIVRCLSHISFLAAFALFSVRRNKERYNPVDTAITYALFIGGFSLEVLSVFITMMSPWTWAWLKLHNCTFLASIGMKWQKRRVLWSNAMGQYSLFNYLGQHSQPPSRVMGVMRKTVNRICGEKQKFWFSQLFDTRFVKVDEKIMRCVLNRIDQYRSHGSSMIQEWPNLGPLLQDLLPASEFSFDYVITWLHVYTEVQLRSVDSESSHDSVDVCRMISEYMLYLLVARHEMLPVYQRNERYLADILHQLASAENISRQAAEMLTVRAYPQPPEVCTEAQLLETQEAWVGLLLYAAGKSRPEMHAAQLARGGELLTFIWLLMAKYELGDSARSPIELTAAPVAAGNVRDQPRYIFQLATPGQ